jgi:hypothetical protein
MRLPLSCIALALIGALTSSAMAWEFIQVPAYDPHPDWGYGAETSITAVSPNGQYFAGYRSYYDSITIREDDGEGGFFEYEEELQVTECFTYTRAGGVQVIPGSASLDDYPYVDANAIDNNGTVVGTYQTDAGAQIFVRPMGGAIQTITAPSDNAYGYSVSPNGQIISGTVNGTVSLLKPGTSGWDVTPMPSSSGWGADLSDDGSVVLGGNQAFWRYAEDPADGQMKYMRLDVAQSGTSTRRTSEVSADGTIIVGAVHPQYGNVPRAAIWDLTSGTGLFVPQPQLLGNLWDPNDWEDQSSLAQVVSADGSLIAGMAKLDPYLQGSETVFLWDAQNGMTDLADILLGLGYSDEEVTDWIFMAATGMSADGNVIAGNGYHAYEDDQGNYVENNESWILVNEIPEPASLALMSIGGLALLRRSR